MIGFLASMLTLKHKDFDNRCPAVGLDEVGIYLLDRLRSGYEYYLKMGGIVELS